MIDYHNFCNKDTPIDIRRKLSIGDIWINAAKCLICGETIRSKNRHDFVTCSCGNLSVDGGSWYIRRYVKEEKYIELSENFNEVIDGNKI